MYIKRSQCLFFLVSHKTTVLWMKDHPSTPPAFYADSLCLHTMLLFFKVNLDTSAIHKKLSDQMVYHLHVKFCFGICTEHNNFLFAHRLKELGFFNSFVQYGGNQAACLRVILNIWTNNEETLLSFLQFQTNCKNLLSKLQLQLVQVPALINTTSDLPCGQTTLFLCCNFIYFSTHKLSLSAIWESPGFSSLLMGSIHVMCVIVLNGGRLSLHDCRRDMIDRRPNRRPSQVSPGCLGHPQFKVHSAQIFEEDTVLDDWEAI